MSIANHLATLLPVELRQIGDAGEVNSVDARNLWGSLNVRRQFAKWWADQVESLGLVEGGDFILLVLKDPQDWGGHNRKDYAISLDAAKGIAMASRTETGKAVRRYFLECERVAMAAPQTLEERSRALIGELDAVVATQKAQLEAQRPLAALGATLERSNVERTPRDVWLAINAHSGRAFWWLRYESGAMQKSRTDLPKKNNLGRFLARESTYTNPNTGETCSRLQCLVTGKGMAWIVDKMPASCYKAGGTREIALRRLEELA